MKQRYTPVGLSWIQSLVLSGILGLVSAAAQEPKKTDGSEKLPPAKDVIEKFVKAVGGREAFLEIDSQHAKGSYSMPAQGIGGDLNVFAAKPNRLLVTISLPGIGEVSTGYNGEVAWMMNAATGPMILKGKQAEQIKEQADFYSILHDPKNYTSMETVRLTEFGGKPCYELKIVKKSGDETTEYFEKESGLWAGFSARQDTPVGEIDVINYFSDYKRFGKVSSPTRITQKLGPVEQVMTIEEISFDKLTAETFALPEEVKALAQ